MSIGDFQIHGTEKIENGTFRLSDFYHNYLIIMIVFRTLKDNHFEHLIKTFLHSNMTFFVGF